jgi:hypothetical protein
LPRTWKNPLVLSCQPLHAMSLTLRHPKTGADGTFEAPCRRTRRGAQLLRASACLDALALAHDVGGPSVVGLLGRRLFFAIGKICEKVPTPKQRGLTRKCRIYWDNHGAHRE